MASQITADRVTINLSPEQIAWLNDIAVQRAASVSDVIRRLIDETRGAYLTPRPKPPRRPARAPGDLPPATADWVTNS